MPPREGPCVVWPFSLTLLSSVHFEAHQFTVCKFQVMLIFVFKCYFSYLRVFPILWPGILSCYFIDLRSLYLVIFHSHTVLLTSRPSSISFRCCTPASSLHSHHPELGYSGLLVHHEIQLFPVLAVFLIETVRKWPIEPWN